MFNTKPSGSFETNGQAYAAQASASDANCSIINEWLTMRGDLESQGDILVKGKVFGNITCKMLIVDTDGLIEGGIAADDVVIRGTTRGTVQAQRIRLERTADVEGELYQDTFSAEEGAKVRGALRDLADAQRLAANQSAAHSNAPVSIARSSLDAFEPAVAKPTNAFFQRLDAARAANATSHAISG